MRKSHTTATHRKMKMMQMVVMLLNHVVTKKYAFRRLSKYCVE